MTSLPAERPVRQEERGRDGRCRCRRADCCETQERPGHKHTGTRGNFAETTDGHNAAPPADPGADVTVHTQSREEAADTTNTSPRLPRLASPRLVTVCAAGRSLGSVCLVGDMSSLTVEEDQKWVPTHVQVTVLRGRSLRGKGKHGTSDVYTIIQLGKEKYSTCVAEKTTEPEWKEECTFELQPGVLENGSPAGSNELVLTVMHRALMGLDVFLGQAVVKLDKVYHESRCVKNE